MAQALVALNLAREASIERVVSLSVIRRIIGCAIRAARRRRWPDRRDALVVTPAASTAPYGIDRSLPFACLSAVLCLQGVFFALPAFLAARRDWH